jgi:hypothetical protein
MPFHLCNAIREKCTTYRQEIKSLEFSLHMQVQVNYPNRTIHSGTKCPKPNPNRKHAVISVPVLCHFCNKKPLQLQESWKGFKFFYQGSFAIQRELLKTILVEKQEKLTLVGSKKKTHIEWRMWRHHGDRNICLAMFLVSFALRSPS